MKEVRREGGMKERAKSEINQEKEKRRKEKVKETWKGRKNEVKRKEKNGVIEG